MRSFFSASALFLCLWILTGVAYPLVVTGVAALLFEKQSQGTLVSNEERVIGSRYIGQTFKDNKYFWSRPSAHNYDALKSGGTNLAPTSKELVKISRERREQLAIAHQSDVKSVPPDLIYASGSGLDPHITIEAAYYQLDRVAKARGMDQGDNKKKIEKLLEDNVQHRTARYMGNTRVNVLILNKELDELTKKSANG